MSGTNGNDTFNGSSAGNSYSGLGGNDVINGNGGNDTLDGGAGADRVDGGVGNDVLYSGTDVDVDTLLGGDGNDTIYAGPEDSVDGGIGTDVLYMDAAGAGAQTLTIGSTGIAFSALPLVTNVEYIRTTLAQGSIVTAGVSGLAPDGAGHQVTFAGTGGRLNLDWSAVTGLAYVTVSGSSSIYNAAGTVVVGDFYSSNVTSSSVTTGSGADNIYGSTGQDTLNGGAGNDNIYGYDDNDSLIGGTGNDTLDGGAGADTLLGGDSNDALYGGAGTDSLDGGIGNDTLNGGTGNDNLDGGTGNDTLDGGAGADRVDGGVGNDVLYSGTDVDVDTLLGGDGNDTIYAGPEDSVDGGIGTDVLYMDATGAGAQTLTIGSTGIAFSALPLVTNVEYIRTTLAQGSIVTAGVSGLAPDGAGHQVTFAGTGGRLNLDWSAVTGLAYVTVSGSSSIYNAAGTVVVGDFYSSNVTSSSVTTGSGADNIYGSTGQDTLNGGAGNDNIYGYDDNDSLIGGTGNDTLDGGAGADTLLGGDSNDALYGGAGTDSLDGGIGNDTLNGGTGNDNLDGGTGNDTLDGGAGADRVDGGVGNDVLYSGTDVDVDTLLGGDGNDTIYAGPEDSVDGGIGTDVLYMDATGAGAQTLTIGSTGIAFSALPLVTNVEYIRTTLAQGSIVTAGVSGLAPDGAGHQVTFAGTGGRLNLDWSAVTGLAYVTVSGSSSIYNAAGTVVVGDFYSSNVTSSSVTTGSGADNIYGSTGQDTLNGGAGNDNIYGYDNNDSLIGGTGNDTLDGGAGADTLLGGDGDDVLSGGAGTDSLDGGTGNDTLDGGAGADRVDGGVGNDELRSGTDTDVDTLLGGDGNDTIYAGREDSVDGGTGNDAALFDFSDRALAVNFLNGAVAGTVYGATIGGVAAGSVVNVESLGVTGGSGDDTIGGVYTSLSDVASLIGNGGTDIAVVDASSLSATALGGGVTNWGGIIDNNGNLLVQLSVEALYFTGNANSLNYGGIWGGTGNDRLIGLGGADTFYGAAGNDTIDGAAGNDSLDGGAGNDSLTGGSGNDTLSAGTGNNIVDGGTGTDVAIFDFTDRNLAVNFLLGSVAGTIYGATVGGVAAGSVVNVESLGVAGGAGDDTIGGVYSAFSDVVSLVGNGGTDIAVVDASSLTSTALGGGIVGWGGILDNNGRYLVGLNVEALYFTGNATNASYGGITGGTGNDRLIGLGGADLFYGDAGNDTIEGAAGNDSLDGGAGNDSLMGGDGNDSLTGGAGNDLIEGGAGNDTLDGGTNIDTISYASATLGITFNLGTTTAQNTGGAGTDTATNFENVLGGSGNDSLTGNSGSNILTGGNGNDTLVGLAGNDTLDGGAGLDTASYAGTTATVTVSLAITTAQDTGGAGTDTLLNIENLTGGTGNDSLTGDGNANRLEGGAGNDTLTGGAGDDTLSGDAGNDIAVFNGARTDYAITRDTVTGHLTVADSVAGRDGTDLVLSGIETLRFSNADYLASVFVNSTLSIAALAADKAEGDAGTTPFTFTVTRSGDLTGLSSAAWSITGGSTNAADFAGGVLPSGTVNFDVGETSKTITLDVQSDSGVEADEGFTLSLSSPGWGALLGTASASGTIRNDDTQYSFSTPTLALAEGIAGSTAFTFTVTRIGFLSAVDVAWAVTGADAGDFAGGARPSGTISFALGATSANITVNVAGDNVVEANEDFLLTLSNLPGNPAITGVTATGTMVNDDASLAITSLSADKAEGNTGTTPFTFTVTRTGDLSGVSSAAWAVTGAGVTGADFVGGALPSGTVTFAAGETTQIVTIQVAGDSALEADEAFTVTLSAPSNATLDTATAAGTIRNDDAVLSVAGGAALAEGNAGTTGFSFTVTRTGDTTTAVSANWVVTGSGANPANAADFSGGALPSGVVNFLAGEVTKTITVDVVGDTAVELNEDFTLTLSSPSPGASFGTASATRSIVNDDASLAITALSADKAEGNTGTTPFTFTVTRTGDLSGVSSAAWAVSGAGVTGADFVGGALPSGTVTFAAGESTQTVTIQVAGDSALEADEAFTVTLSAPSIATLGTASADGSIRNDDAVLSVAGGAALAEGNIGTTGFSFTVTRTGDTTTAASAAWAVTGSGANPASAADFIGNVLPSGVINFFAGEITKTITVDVIGDTAVELNEDFTLTLSAPSAGVSLGTASATRTIVNDDASLSIVTTTGNLLEGNSGSVAHVFTVTRTGDTSVVHSAAWSVSGAVTADDFAGGVLPSGTLTFAAGETSKTITVQAAGDTLGELDESFAVTLASPSAGAVIGTASASSTIRNDDAVAGTSLAIAALSADKAEGNTGTTAFTFTVTRTGDLSGPSSASWATTGSGERIANSGDFIGGAGTPLPRGTVSFAAGETTKIITVSVLGDTRYEGDEGFTVTLSSPSSGVSITTATALGVIREDDFILGTTGNDTLRSSTLADYLRGLAGDDYIQAEGNNDTLEGNEGNDTLNGGTGADSLIGGDGFDYASYLDATAGVALSLVTGGTLGDALGDRYRGIEGVFGSAFDDNITGDDIANLLQGGAGNDTLIGGAGDDTLFGGAGADNLVGGEGRDVVIFLSNLPLAVDLNGVGSSGEAFGDTYSGIEDVIGRNSGDTILGSAVANLLDGGLGDDSLAGREGNDTLLGGAGNDTLLGGAGDDSLVGGDGKDLVSYADATAGVTVSLAILTAQATGGSGLDVLSGFENLTGSAFNDSLTGDALANILIGGAGNDTLIGGEGDDTLEGGGGADVLTGGEGWDRFVFRSIDDSTPRLSGRDVITDFNRVIQERIDLRAIDANPFLDGDQAFTWITGDFTGTPGELSVVSFARTSHRVRMDVDGDGAEDMVITVMANIASMTATDFFL